MRIGIYDPYLDTLGGGERYILTAASCLSADNDVSLFWSDASIIKTASQKLNIDLSNVSVVPNIFSSTVPTASRVMQTSKYDRLLFLSDGSIPWLFAKKNILLFHFPVNWVNGKSFANRIKLKKINKIICYTKFVKNYLDKTFQTSTQVIYPPVELFGAAKKKENIILSVGRFTKAMNAKKQDVLIDTFKKMCNDGLKNWKFVLAGSYLPGDEDFVDRLREDAKGFPIEILTNATFQELKSYYQKAQIYWHAAGYGEDLEKHPERAEHFGITTAEAMGSGCVPIVINAGGQKEIVRHGESGFLWDTLTEFSDYTQKTIEDSELFQKLSKNAEKRASEFGIDHFCGNIRTLFEQ